MKKALVIAIFAFFVVTIFASCRPKQRCAAYGHFSKIENTEQNKANS